MDNVQKLDFLCIYLHHSFFIYLETHCKCNCTKKCRILLFLLPGVGDQDVRPKEKHPSTAISGRGTPDRGNIYI